LATTYWLIIIFGIYSIYQYFSHFISFSPTLSIHYHY
jgi:hypothetical protein